ncbi:MAG TPA: lysylphosphatidylglycerol synthase transmembrane domain-containing protein [Solirubrobacterales bacterium]|nr:lysylphosphatidylglycerol synthase transmembrane domain-containing protein [Solirubrobacterales bacterium]
MREERTASAQEEEEAPRELVADDEPSIFGDRKRLIQTLVAVVLLTVAIYVLVPRLFDLQDAIGKIGDGDPLWIGIGILCCVAMFGAYVALFRGVVGEHVIHLEWRESYEITMAGLAATRLFSAGGAGGILLTYWALRKAGMERRRSVCRMVAFLVVLYSVYLVALMVFGILLRTHVLSGEAPLSGTIIPAVLAAIAIVVGLLLALLPDDIERRIEGHTSGRFGKIARRLATAPATFSQGTRTAIAFVRHPSAGAMAIGGAIGFWAANIAILWASFHAFDVQVPLGVVVQGFFLGMLANLFPFAPGGVGAVDAGMIGAFVLFGLPSTEVFAAVLTYRVIAFWLPIPPGIIAFFQLRNTVHRWEAEGRDRPERLDVGKAETAAAGP